MENKDPRAQDRDRGTIEIEPAPGKPFPQFLLSPPFWIFAILLMVSFVVGQKVPPTWTADRITIDVQQDKDGSFYTYEGQRKSLPAEMGAYEASPLSPDRLKTYGHSGPTLQEDYVQSGESVLWLRVKRHWGAWSLLPAITAVILCWLTREPITALLGGIIAGAFLLGQYDLTDEVLVPSLATQSAAQILLLYLVLLGGLMGVWSRMGAPRAFADLMTHLFVRGPRSARVVAWFLGVVFFQGGTVSTVLVGTTVKPLADKEKISHEELAYIVDSTASPIASLLAFNAWPGYVQAFIFVSGAGFLATEADRVAFFFKTIPLHFYSIFAVLGTLLFALDLMPWVSKNMRDAITRARTTGQLDAPDSNPLSAKELEEPNVPDNYHPHVVDFFLPLGVLIALSIGTFISSGSPNVRWAFGAALLSACALAVFKGMSLNELMDGITTGLKGVVMGTVILLLAITIGGISKATGGGNYLVEQLGGALPFWLLPMILMILTIIIAFSTGTSWGTYAVSLPLAMPLAWAIAESQGLSHPMLYMMICFSAVIDGSVFGDQCSPISDTTVLSSMCTGCDLMDHVRTQLPQASLAAVLATVLWTAVTLVFV